MPASDGDRGIHNGMRSSPRPSAKCGFLSAQRCSRRSRLPDVVIRLACTKQPSKPRLLCLPLLPPPAYVATLPGFNIPLETSVRSYPMVGADSRSRDRPARPEEVSPSFVCRQCARDRGPVSVNSCSHHNQCNGSDPSGGIGADGGRAGGVDPSVRCPLGTPTPYSYLNVLLADDLHLLETGAGSKRRDWADLLL